MKSMTSYVSTRRAGNLLLRSFKWLPGLAGFLYFPLGVKTFIPATDGGMAEKVKRTRCRSANRLLRNGAERNEAIVLFARGYTFLDNAWIFIHLLKNHGHEIPNHTLLFGLGADSSSIWTNKQHGRQCSSCLDKHECHSFKNY